MFNDGLYSQNGSHERPQSDHKLYKDCKICFIAYIYAIYAANIKKWQLLRGWRLFSHRQIKIIHIVDVHYKDFSL